ncbi:hypothetical protein [Caulobacter sp. DWR3-1-2]|uniref:hypothetical protein n=1 Tax=Caulobacter sp. DWR3-1-2 TaxID=2804647 RepID=UPI003CF7C4A7
MAKRPATFRPGNARPLAERNQQADARRGSASSRGYNARWGKARQTHLDRSPLCRWHEHDGVIVAARVVDHWIPHDGDSAVFWNTSRWVSLCVECHSGRKQSLERLGLDALVTMGRRLGLDL